MKIEKVSYGKTYALGNYCSERIDLEASIDEGENIAQVFDMLKGICDGQHKLNNPHLHQEYLSQFNEPTAQVIEPQSLEEKISPEQEMENTIAEIENATAETLPTFQLQAAKNQKTMGAYNRRKKQLNLN